MTPVANALVIIADRIARSHPEEAEALLHMAASDAASHALARIVREHARDR